MNMKRRVQVLSCVVLVVALLLGATFARAQTITLSSIFNSSTDALADINTSRTYTHLLKNASGNQTVNGVTFNSVATGESVTGSNYTFGGLTHSYTTTFFGGFNYRSYQGQNNSVTFTLTGLTPGQTYDLRFYAARWSSDMARNFDVTFYDHGTAKATYANYDEDSHSLGGTDKDGTSKFHYLDIVYTPTNTDIMVAFKQLSSSNMPYSFFALSNEVSAIPEPSTYAAIFGAIALGATAWVRRRNKAG